MDSYKEYSDSAHESFKDYELNSQSNFSKLANIDAKDIRIGKLSPKSVQVTPMKSQGELSENQSKIKSQGKHGQNQSILIPQGL